MKPIEQKEINDQAISTLKNLISAIDSGETDVTQILFQPEIEEFEDGTIFRKLRDTGRRTLRIETTKVSMRTQRTS